MGSGSGEIGDLATSWVSWWIGDTLGVLVVLPLMFVAVGEPRRLWRSRATTGGCSDAAIFRPVRRDLYPRQPWEHDEGLLEFRLLSQEIGDKIHSGLAEQEIFLAQLERSFSAPHRCRGQNSGIWLKIYCSGFRRYRRSNGRRGLVHSSVWALRKHSGGSCQASKSAKSDPSGQRRRAGERALYYPVTYVEPLNGNEHIVGFDLASEPGRKTAVEETVDTGSVTTTPPIRLVQERGEQVGILVIFAVQDGPQWTRGRLRGAADGHLHIGTYGSSRCPA